MDCDGAVACRVFRKGSKAEKGKREEYGSEGMALGMCFGVAVSTALHVDVGLGMMAGMMLGLLIGSHIDKAQKG